ncbi:GNAT family N-acetyltransferase [Alphaproteobacteria bacterium]|nr:GNAT family N-acetyltransferase [Alphaproteobacteria bacterium]
MSIKFNYTNGTKAHAKPIIDFLSRLFPGLNQELWDWEYKNAPCNSSIITAEHNGCLIGHYACINYEFVISGSVVSGGKAEGSLVNLRKVAVLPKEVSKGIFTRLVKKLLKNKSDENYDIIFGFSNSLALPGQIEAGFKLIEIPMRSAILIRDLSSFVQPSNQLSNFLLLIINRFLSVIQFALRIDFIERKFEIVNLTDINPEEVDSFASEYNLNYPEQNTIHRDAKFYSWRFINNPYCTSTVLVVKNSRGKIEGVSALCQKKENMGTIQIQDLIATNQRAIRALLKAAIDFANLQRANSLEIWSGKSLAHQAVNTQLKRLGFMFGKQQRKKMIVWSENYQSNVTDPYSWYVTMAFRRH